MGISDDLLRSGRWSGVEVQWRWNEVSSGAPSTRLNECVEASSRRRRFLPKSGGAIVVAHACRVSVEGKQEAAEADVDLAHAAWRTQCSPES